MIDYLNAKYSFTGNDKIFTDLTYIYFLLLYRHGVWSRQDLDWAGLVIARRRESMVTSSNEF